MRVPIFTMFLLFPMFAFAQADLQSIVETRWLTANNTHNENERNTLIDSLFASDFESYGMGGVVTHGAGGLKHYLTDIRTKISDYRISIEDIAQSNNKVWFRIHATGNHIGPLLGKGATGKQISVNTFVVLEFSGEHITREWLITDIIALMNQIEVEFTGEGDTIPNLDH